MIIIGIFPTRDKTSVQFHIEIIPIALITFGFTNDNWITASEK